MMQAVQEHVEEHVQRQATSLHMYVHRVHVHFMGRIKAQKFFYAQDNTAHSSDVDMLALF